MSPEAGAHPPAFDPAIYRNRNAVDRGYNRLEQWRGTATRYDTAGEAFAGR